MRPFSRRASPSLLGSDIGYGRRTISAARRRSTSTRRTRRRSTRPRQAGGHRRHERRHAPPRLHHYRALCCIALGRTAEADQAIALSVAADPFTVPDTSELAPRVASVFSAARARLVPEVARAALADGRQLMQKGDAAARQPALRGGDQAAVGARTGRTRGSERSHAGGQRVRRADAGADGGGRAAAAAAARAAAVPPPTRPPAAATTPASPAATPPPASRRRRAADPASRSRRRRAASRQPRAPAGGRIDAAAAAQRRRRPDSCPPCRSRRRCRRGNPEPASIAADRIHGRGAGDHRRHRQGDRRGDGTVRLSAVRSAGPDGGARVDLPARDAQRTAGRSRSAWSRSCCGRRRLKRSEAA